MKFLRIGKEGQEIPVALDRMENIEIYHRLLKT